MSKMKPTELLCSVSYTPGSSRAPIFKDALYIQKTQRSKQFLVYKGKSTPQLSHYSPCTETRFQFSFGTVKDLKFQASQKASTQTLSKDFPLTRSEICDTEPIVALSRWNDITSNENLNGAVSRYDTSSFAPEMSNMNKTGSTARGGKRRGKKSVTSNFEHHGQLSFGEKCTHDQHFNLSS